MILENDWKLVVATRNKGKIREIRKALKGLGLRIHRLNDFPDVPEIEEDGKSFTENALKKARFYSKYFGKLTLADDSGLEVDALKGMPGISFRKVCWRKGFDSRK